MEREGWEKGDLGEGEDIVESGGGGRRGGQAPVLGSRGAELRWWTMSVMDFMVPFLFVVVGVSWDQLGVLTELWRGRVRTS